MCNFTISILIFCLPILSFAEDKDTLSLGIPNEIFNPKRTFSVVGTEIIGYTGTMVVLNNLWYKDYPRSSFHWFNDNQQWLQMDKMGHACLLYTSDAADDSLRVDLGGRRIIKKTIVVRMRR